ncbi:hypothetical protein QTV44_002477 [Vibrio vulnificus]|nr:hypothetical protein [Vibrio vulnificus]
MNRTITFLLSVGFLFISFSSVLITVLSGTEFFPSSRVELLMAAIALSLVAYRPSIAIYSRLHPLLCVYESKENAASERARHFSSNVAQKGGGMLITNVSEYQSALNELQELGEIPLCVEDFNELYGERYDELTKAVAQWQDVTSGSIKANHATPKCELGA